MVRYATINKSPIISQFHNAVKNVRDPKVAKFTTQQRKDVFVACKGHIYLLQF